MDKKAMRMSDGGIANNKDAHDEVKSDFKPKSNALQATIKQITKFNLLNSCWMLVLSLFLGT